MLLIETAIQIEKPSYEVFDFIHDFNHLKKNFISDYKGKVAKGEKVLWVFEDINIRIYIYIKNIIPYSLFSFQWSIKDYTTNVEINITPLGLNNCIVKITEKEMPINEDGLKWLKQNTEAWANFLACLKAYAEYSINLRKNAFDYLRNS